VIEDAEMMRFAAEHDFACSVGALTQAMVDPELYLRLEIPDLSQPDIVGRRGDGDGQGLQLRYAFVGRLDPIARRLVGDDSLRWLQDLQVDSSALTGRLSFASEDRGRRLHGEADITFISRDQGTTRRIEGELVVAVPIIGGMAERSIVAGLVRRLDLEATAVQKQLDAG
jgi:hypothetical protein